MRARRGVHVGREKSWAESKSLQPSPSQRQTNGVAVTVNCNGPRLTLTTLTKYVPLWLTVEFSTATPFVASTVCSATPEGFTSTSLYGTITVDSATTEISCAPAGIVKPLVDV